MKVMSVFGTRPEAIKMCPVVLELQKQPGIESVVCVTAQHRQMLDPVLDIFGVRPQHDLDIMRESQTLFDITADILLKIRAVLEAEKPDLVLVHGDTTTAFTAALACFYQQIPVGHVEAGLRTYDLQAPFPEEFNRQAVDLVARFLFAPTATARENLLAEGKAGEAIFVTGNTGIDALRYTVREGYRHPQLDWVGTSRLVLVTAHRRESLGPQMAGMFRAIRRAAQTEEDIKVIYPVHLNPAVRAIADAELAGVDNVRLIEPLDAVDFHNFMKRSYLLLTDSGGIQEEAPALDKPVLVMREVTERPEGLQAGTLELVGTDEARVYAGIHRYLNDKAAYQAMSRAKNPYGDGHASERIVKIIVERFGAGR
ncbi:MAG: non-hydrolyzing UDP-N-acetylglucosamine 2-epimerase [Oscillospiraceae bacterium]